MHLFENDNISCTKVHVKSYLFFFIRKYLVGVRVFHWQTILYVWISCRQAFHNFAFHISFDYLWHLLSNYIWSQNSSASFHINILILDLLKCSASSCVANWTSQLSHACIILNMRIYYNMERSYFFHVFKLKHIPQWCQRKRARCTLVIFRSLDCWGQNSLTISISIW